MYDNLIADVEAFKTKVSRYHTQPFDPKPEWFEELDFTFCPNSEYAYNSTFEFLLVDRYRCDAELERNPSAELSTQRAEIMNKLVAEFKQIHADADNATKTILIILDEIINSLRAEELPHAESLALDLLDHVGVYEYLCGICEDFATVVHGKGCRYRLNHFYDGAELFYANPDEGYEDEACYVVGHWVKRFRSDIAKLTNA